VLLALDHEGNGLARRRGRKQGAMVSVGRDYNADNLIAGLSGSEVGQDGLFHGELVTLVAAERESRAVAVLLERHKGDEDETTAVGDAAELNDDDETVGALRDSSAVPGGRDEDAAATDAAEKQSKAEKQKQLPFHRTTPAF
jgi:hypothetical protein